MRLLVTFACGALLALTASSAYAEPFSVSQIIKLSNLKMGDDAIIAKIKSSENSYDLSTEQMIELKQKGVSSAVIAAMLDKRAAVASPIRV
jgi:precorrin-4 methylase